MPIDDELLETARTIHDQMMALGMFNEAAAVRLAVSAAVADQEEEEQFGTERVAACVEAMTNFKSALTSLADRRPVTAADVSSILKSSIPEIRLMVEAENGPMWLRNMVVPVNEGVRKLVAELQREDPKRGLRPGGQMRLAQCVSSLGAVRAGANDTSSQT